MFILEKGEERERERWEREGGRERGESGEGNEKGRRDLRGRDRKEKRKVIKEVLTYLRKSRNHRKS